MPGSPLFFAQGYRGSTKQINMKAPKSVEMYPKMLVVGRGQTDASHNAHLLVPYQPNEIVKVAGPEEQEPNRKYDHLLKYAPPLTVEQFRHRYVTIYRKDPTDGSWSMKYVISWNNVHMLNAIRNGNDKVNKEPARPIIWDNE